MLGVDASLTSTGLCWRDDDGEIYTSRIAGKDFRGSRRVAYMVNAFERHLDESNPGLVVIEKYAITGRMGMNSVLALAELAGSLKVAAWKRGAHVLIITPGTWKLVLTGLGRGTYAKGDKLKTQKEKARITDAIGELLGIDIPQNDEADACGLMVAGEVYADSPYAKAIERKSTRVGKLYEGEVEQGKMQLIAKTSRK